MPPEAARSAPISWEMASRRCTSSMISASHASISPRSAPIRVRRDRSRRRGWGGGGAHRVSFGVLVAVGPLERETPRAPRARGVCCGVCSASGDGHRIPVTVEKADRGEHGSESATRSAPATRHDRRWGGCGAGGRRRGSCPPIRLTVMCVMSSVQQSPPRRPDALPGPRPSSAPRRVRSGASSTACSPGSTARSARPSSTRAGRCSSSPAPARARPGCSRTASPTCSAPGTPSPARSWRSPSPTRPPAR